MKTNNYDKLKSFYSKHNRFILAFVIMLFIISIFLSIKSLTKPIYINKKMKENNIEQLINYNYFTKVKPCLLYPEGGQVNSGEVIFTNITDEMFVNVKYHVNSDENIKILGNKSVKLCISSEGFWSKEYILEEKTSFKKTGNEIDILNNDYSINLEEISTFIKGVEKEIKLGSGKYLIKVKPQLEGNIFSCDKKIPIKNDTEFIFEYNGRYLKLASEKEFSEKNKTEKIQKTKQYFNIFNNKVSLLKVRYISTILALISLLILATMLVHKIKKAKFNASKSDKIDKKYSSRLIYIEDDISAFDKEIIDVENFKSLLKVADERELPILRHKNQVGSVSYYTIDNNCVYRLYINEELSVESKNN